MRTYFTASSYETSIDEHTHTHMCAVRTHRLPAFTRQNEHRAIPDDSGGDDEIDGLNETKCDSIWPVAALKMRNAFSVQGASEQSHLTSFLANRPCRTTATVTEIATEKVQIISHLNLINSEEERSAFHRPYIGCLLRGNAPGNGNWCCACMHRWFCCERQTIDSIETNRNE